MQFSAETILENLRDPEAEHVSSLPKRGELFLFKGKGVTAQDWRADDHWWINQGLAMVAPPRKNPKIKKKTSVSQLKMALQKNLSNLFTVNLERMMGRFWYNTSAVMKFLNHTLMVMQNTLPGHLSEQNQALWRNGWNKLNLKILMSYITKRLLKRKCQWI